MSTKETEKWKLREEIELEFDKRDSKSCAYCLVVVEIEDCCVVLAGGDGSSRWNGSMKC